LKVSIASHSTSRKEAIAEHIGHKALARVIDEMAM
jgi:hypothetical protein